MPGQCRPGIRKRVSLKYHHCRVVTTILKGWFDRVFVSGGLYSSRKRYGAGHFRGKRAICSVTTGAPEHAFGPKARGGDLDAILWPIERSLYYREARLHSLPSEKPMNFPGWADWDNVNHRRHR